MTISHGAGHTTTSTGVSEKLGPDATSCFAGDTVPLTAAGDISNESPIADPSREPAGLQPRGRSTNIDLARQATAVDLAGLTTSPFNPVQTTAAQPEATLVSPGVGTCYLSPTPLDRAEIFIVWNEHSTEDLNDLLEPTRCKSHADLFDYLQRLNRDNNGNNRPIKLVDIRLRNAVEAGLQDSSGFRIPAVDGLAAYRYFRKCLIRYPEDVRPS